MNTSLLNTLWVLLVALAVVGGVAALMRAMDRRARHRRRGALAEQQPDLTHSAWQNLTQRYHRNRVEALRDWMAEKQAADDAADQDAKRKRQANGR